MRLLAVTTLILFCSCLENRQIQECPSASFRTDIPVAFTDSEFVKFKRKILEFVGLAPLTQGFSQLQVRIWYGYPYSNRENLLVFTKTADKWTGESLLLRYWSEKTDGKDSVSADKKSVTPQSGWSVFIDSLISRGMLTLRDCSDIPGYSCLGAGNSIIVEFATCDTYRIYRLDEPWRMAAKFEEAKRITEINAIIERQLSFRRFWVDKE